jgi:putative methionine-R-sulfoxide reductase with GAF domain
VKTYCPASELLAEIKGILAGNHLASGGSPLDRVIERLCRGRHYTWAGIYVAVGERNSRRLLGSASDAHPGQTSLPETRSKILISIKLAGREVGVLDVESDQENAFGAEDRVLLEGAAHLLGLFLAGRGKFVVRKAREAALASSRS